MDFNDTPEEAAFRAEARAWLQANAKPVAPGEAPGGMSERDDPGVIRDAKAWQAKKYDAGWACITWPKEYGGRGGTSIQRVIWGQEESKFSVPPDIYGIGLGMLGPTLMTHGTDEQKQRFLKKMARGEEVWCQLFSEPAAGSDLAGLRMTATRDGDDWLINGQKIWTTGAHYCDWGMIVTRSDTSVPKHAGLTYFIVDMKAPGIEIRPIKQMRVPDDLRLGAVGNGWAVAITTLMHERASIGAGAGGAGFSELFEMAKRVELDGRPALEDSAVRQRLADFYIRSRGLQYTGYRTLTALSRGQTPGPESSIGKLIGAPLRQQMASFAVELEGAAGSVMGEDDVWQETYLASPGIRIAGGTDEIMRNIIAERVLRLPPEPRLDKDVAFRDVPTGPPGR
jgi:alkylation response protein AidB-like acyl-CoA dehydrogenase